MSLFGKARLFLAKPSAMQQWFVPVWCLLGLTRLAKAVLPFRLIARYLGPATAPGAVVAATPDQQARAARIGRIVRMAARHTPWTSDCYPQALAAVLMLRLASLPYVVTFGLQRGGQEVDGQSADMLAHCWVTSGDTVVCGGAGRPILRPGAALISRRPHS